MRGVKMKGWRWPHVTAAAATAATVAVAVAAAAAAVAAVATMAAVLPRKYRHGRFPSATILNMHSERKMYSTMLSIKPSNSFSAIDS